MSPSLELSKLNRGGLKAGTAAPSFSLHDLAGTQRTLTEFRGKRVLLVFAGPECGPCQALTPELVKLHQQHHTNNLEVIIISRGGSDANRTKAQKHGITFPVLLQHHWEISKKYATFAAPAGYLIDEQGVITKDVAVGAEAVLRLVP